jgi:hypothetical protein
MLGVRGKTSGTDASVLIERLGWRQFPGVRATMVTAEAIAISRTARYRGGQFIHHRRLHVWEVD